MDKNFLWLRTLKRSYLWLITVLISLILSELIVSLMGLLLKGEITADYLLTGLVASSLVPSVIVNLFDACFKQIENLEENNSRLQEAILNKTESEEELRKYMMESLPGIFYMFDKSGQFLMWNQNFEKTTQRKADELHQMHPLDLFDITERHLVAQRIKEVFSTGHGIVEASIVAKDGSCNPYYLTGLRINRDGQELLIGTGVDITERKRTEEQINQLAFYDPLTHLPNRRLLLEHIHRSIDACKRSNKQLAVLMLDLDKFKPINDNFGHSAGDTLLKLVAERLTTSVRANDLVVRLGGDEFVIVINEIDSLENLSWTANRIIDNLSQPFLIEDHKFVHIGTSIGISIYPDQASNTEELLDQADTALYAAKNQGRGCFSYFSEEMTEKARERLTLETSLRRAIAQQELRVFFQPQIDIESGQMIGAEALVRWYNQDKNQLIYPDHFIPIAEESGLILSIGEWVLRETCMLGKQWLDQGLKPITLAVNVSPNQFQRCDIAELVSRVLHDTGFPADHLELEITESGLMNNQDNAMAILNNLNNLGVDLTIDDFGTGYSSLSYLKYFPLKKLKIDKCFIDDIPFSESDMTIASSIISLAHCLGLKVTAEGVETQEQITFLQQQGCDSYQGFLYSQPISADDFAILLFSNNASLN